MLQHLMLLCSTEKGNDSLSLLPSFFLQTIMARLCLANQCSEDKKKKREECLLLCLFSFLQFSVEVFKVPTITWYIESLSGIAKGSLCFFPHHLD